MTTDSSISSASSTQPAVLTADQLLSKSLSQATGAIDPNAPNQPGILSPADLLKRAQDAANGIIDPPIVQNISASAASLTPPQPPAPVPYTQQDWYITAKVAQLKGLISMYATLPGLDPAGAIMDSLTKEVNDLVNQQKAKLTAANAAAAAAQKKLDAANAAKDKSTSSSALLANVQGTAKAPAPSDAVNALLKQAQQQASGINTFA
jgi:hypothetical protein